MCPRMPVRRCTVHDARILRGARIWKSSGLAWRMHIRVMVTRAGRCSYIHMDYPVPATSCGRVYNPATDGWGTVTCRAYHETLNVNVQRRQGRMVWPALVRGCRDSAKRATRAGKVDADPLKGTLAAYPGPFLHIGLPAQVTQADIPGG